MGVDVQKTIDWYHSNANNITYTWGFEPFNYGPRSVVDYASVGSTDCSGGMYSALVYAGAKPSAGIGATPPYITTNIGSFLAQNGYEKIYSGPNTGGDGMWEYKPGDIVNMGAGSIENSAGAAGHIGVISNDIKFMSVTAAEGAGAGPVACHTNDPIPGYWGQVAGALTYFEVWRNTNSNASEGNTSGSSNSQPTKPSNTTKPSGTKAEKTSSRLYRYNDFVFGGIGDQAKKNVKKDTTSNANTNGNNNPSSGDSSAPPPTDGMFGHIFKEPYIVVQPYGYTSFSVANPQVYPGGKHTGIDIHPKGIKAPADVYAPCDGEVLWMGSGAGMTAGGYMMMTAPNGMYVYLGHFSELNVSVGQQLKKGQHIGKDMLVNAYHIHLEYSNANTAGNGVNDMDPKDIIPGKYVNDWYAEVEM